MDIGDHVVYVASADGETFEVYGEIVGFESADWTRSGREAAVQFPNPNGNGCWIQYIDPARLEVISEQK